MSPIPLAKRFRWTGAASERQAEESPRSRCSLRLGRRTFWRAPEPWLAGASSSVCTFSLRQNNFFEGHIIPHCVPEGAPDHKTADRRFATWVAVDNGVGQPVPG